MNFKLAIEDCWYKDKPLFHHNSLISIDRLTKSQARKW